MEETVTSPLCIWKHPAALPRSMPSLQMCSAVRSSRALIFDVSYGGSVACKPKQRQRFTKSTSIETSNQTAEILPRSPYSGVSGDVRGWNSEKLQQTFLFVLRSCPPTHNNNNNPLPLLQTCFGEVHEDHNNPSVSPLSYGALTV